VPSGVEAILNLIGGLPNGTPVAFEAAYGWGWLVELLEDYGFDPHRVHPLRCTAIASARLNAWRCIASHESARLEHARQRASHRRLASTRRSGHDDQFGHTAHHLAEPRPFRGLCQLTIAYGRMSPAATAAVGAATMGPALRSRAPPPTRAHCYPCARPPARTFPLLPHCVPRTLIPPRATRIARAGRHRASRS
jgi:hypothetical protein